MMAAAKVGAIVTVELRFYVGFGCILNGLKASSLVFDLTDYSSPSVGEALLSRLGAMFIVVRISSNGLYFDWWMAKLLVDLVAVPYG